MSEFSPAAQAVYDAFNRIGLYNEPTFETDRKALAAALRALTRTCFVEEAEMCGWFCGAIRTEDILDIAAEIEGAGND